MEEQTDQGLENVGGEEVVEEVKTAFKVDKTKVLLNTVADTLRQMDSGMKSEAFYAKKNQALKIIRELQ